MSRIHRVMAVFAVTLSAATAYADNLPYMIQDIESRPTPTSSSPENFMPLGDRVVFAANTPEVGNGLWISDGTAAGTSLLRSAIVLYASPLQFGYLNGELYFAASDEPRVGAYDLWATDGTPAGTRMVREMPFSSPSFSAPGYFVAHAGRLYFSIYDGADFPMWVTDGTAEGTTEFFHGVGSAALASVGGRLLFQEFQEGTGTELWTSDGGDGDNDLQDLSFLLANFGGGGPTGDLDGDGDVDLQDLSTLLSNFGDSVRP